MDMPTPFSVPTLCSSPLTGKLQIGDGLKHENCMFMQFLDPNMVVGKS